MPQRFPAQSNTLDAFLKINPTSSPMIAHIDDNLSSASASSSSSANFSSPTTIISATDFTSRKTFPVKPAAALLHSATKSQLIRYLRRHGKAGNSGHTKPELMERSMRCAIGRWRGLGIMFTWKELMGVAIYKKDIVGAVEGRDWNEATFASEDGEMPSNSTARLEQTTVMTVGHHELEEELVGLEIEAAEEDELICVRKTDKTLAVDGKSTPHSSGRRSVKHPNYSDVGIQTDPNLDMVEFEKHLEEIGRASEVGLTAKMGMLSIRDSEEDDDDYVLTPLAENFTISQYITAPQSVISSEAGDVFYTCPTSPVQSTFSELWDISNSDCTNAVDLTNDEVREYLEKALQKMRSLEALASAEAEPVSSPNTQRCVFPGAFLKDSQVLRNDGPIIKR